MRAITETDRKVLAADRYAVHMRVLVTDSDAVERDLSDLEGIDWVVSAEWSLDIDQPIVQPRIQLRREVEGTGLSLSPFAEDSPLNYDGDDVFRPLIDAGRRIRILTATVPTGVVPAAADWREVFAGEIDEVEWQTDPMLVLCRDPGGALQDTIIEDPQEYGSEEGVLLHVVMQQLLDDVLGAGAVTLHVPDPPGFMVTAYRPDSGPLMEALQACAGAIGWDVRYLWSETSQAYELTLVHPDRDASEPVHVFGPDDYIDVTRLAVSRADVRNVVQVEYEDRVSHQTERVTVYDPTSIGRYGRRFMRITEGGDSPIDTAAEALAMADAALDDLAEPFAEQQIELRYWWPAQLGDLYLFRANGVHYTTDQVLAAVGIRHHLSEGRQRTTLLCRGRPSGGYLTWLKRARRPVESTTTLYAQCQVTLVETHPDHLIFEVTAEPDHGTVKLAALDGATLIDGPAAGTAAPSGTQWTIGRPDQGDGQGLATFGAEAPGYVSDSQPMVIAEQGRDTVALVMRATVVGQTDTTQTVRVAVADPLAGAGLTNVVIAVAATNVENVDWPGKPPVVPLAEIPAAELTADLDTTGYVDFTITRKPAGSGDGSVTWTASALSATLEHLRVQASDTQVVPALPPEVPVEALPPTVHAVVESLTDVSAQMRVTGTDWQGGTSGLEWSWRWHTLGDPLPTWGPWQSLPAAGVIQQLARHAGRDRQAYFRVMDSAGRISPDFAVRVPAQYQAIDPDTGRIDLGTPTSDGRLLEDQDGAQLRADQAEAGAINEMHDRGLKPDGFDGQVGRGAGALPALTVAQQVQEPSQNLLPPGAGAEVAITGSTSGVRRVEAMPWTPLAALGLIPGDVLSISCDIITDGQGSLARPQLVIERPGGDQYVQPAAYGGTSWARRVRADFTIPEDATRIRVFRIQESGAVGTATFRRMMLNRGPIALPFEEPPLRPGRGEGYREIPGNLPPWVRLESAGSPRVLVSGAQEFARNDGQGITFDPPFENAPLVIVEGPMANYGPWANKTYYRAEYAENVTASGVERIVCQFLDIFSSSPQSKNFPGGVLTMEGQRLELGGVGTPANDNRYTVDWTGTLQAIADSGLTQANAELTVAVATRASSGAQWVERATRTYNATAAGGPGVVQNIAGSVEIAVTPLHDISIVIKKFTVQTIGSGTAVASVDPNRATWRVQSVTPTNQTTIMPARVIVLGAFGD